MSSDRRWAERVRYLTMGKRQHLNGTADKLYWSDFKESDERDDPNGGPFYASPVAAIAQLGRATGFLKMPTNENQEETA